nr:MoaD/ThiS family protein [Anaerolineae bacterium]
MSLTAKLILRDKEYEVRAGQTLRDAIQKCDLSPQAVLPVLDGQLITDDQILRPGDIVMLVSVISGG